MSSLYADATGKGIAGRPSRWRLRLRRQGQGKAVEVIAADHQNKPDIGVSMRATGTQRESRRDLRRADSRPLRSRADAREEQDQHQFRRRQLRYHRRRLLADTVHWNLRHYALSNVAGKAMVSAARNTWFFITADYAFGMVLERDAANIVKESGGKVLGDVRHPLNSSDFSSSFCCQAQASKAKVVGARQ